MSIRSSTLCILATTVCWAVRATGQEAILWDAGVKDELRRSPHVHDPAVRCGMHAFLPNRFSGWCHCTHDYVAINTSRHPLTGRYCPASNLARVASAGISEQGPSQQNVTEDEFQNTETINLVAGMSGIPRQRWARFPRTAIGHCDCVNPVAPYARQAADAVELDGVRTRMIHLSPVAKANVNPKIGGPFGNHLGKSGTELNTGARRVGGAREGWTELFTRNDFGWWDGPVGKIEGHMLTRSFVLHHPAVVSCGGGRLSIRVTAANHSSETSKSSDDDAGDDVARHNTMEARVVGSTTTDRAFPVHAFPIGFFGMHAGHPLKPTGVTVEWSDGPVGRTTSSVVSVTQSGPPVVVVAFERRHHVNHFHYGSVRWSLHALALCSHVALLAGLHPDQITCLPIATATDSSAQETVAEYPQFRDFQRRVFGRGFTDECAVLEGRRVLGVTFGESADPLLNFPFGSDRAVQGGALGTLSEANETLRRRCARGDSGAVSGGWDPETSRRCHAIAKWHRSHGHSTDLPKFLSLRRPLAALRSRVIGEDRFRPLTRRVVLFQRNGCPFPPRFRRDNNAWKTRFAPAQKHRCLLNIEEIEGALRETGFEVDVIDWSLRKYQRYDAVVTELQNASVFIGVEGAGSLHSMWMPAGRSGFLQLHPQRWAAESYWGNSTVDLYTEAWVHYYGVCVHNWRLGEIHQTPIDPATLARAVSHLHTRLTEGTCRTCSVEPQTGLCPRPGVFN